MRLAFVRTAVDAKEGGCAIVAVFLGIVIRMYHDDHAPPHFHVEYAEYSAIISIDDGKILAGRLPRRAARLVEEWRQTCISQLMRGWRDAQAGRTPRRIRPLE